MAVTSGKDTGKNMGGGASGGPSGGGPGGGSLSAPNRTAPSSGAGGQRGSGGSGMRGAGSNTGPGSARPGSDTSSKAASSASSSKSSTASKSTGPDRGPTSAPARTTPSSGITSGRSAAQQKSVDKAKQSYSQYGGAQTSMRNATVSKAAPSAKVTDPSRGITSPMSGQGASFSSPQSAKKANDAYVDRYGFANKVNKSLPSAMEDVIDVRNRMGPFKGPLKGGMMDDRVYGPFNPNDPYKMEDRRKIARDNEAWRDADNRKMAVDGSIVGNGRFNTDDQRTPQEVAEQAKRIGDYIGKMDAQKARVDRGYTQPKDINSGITSFVSRLSSSSLTPDISINRGVANRNPTSFNRGGLSSKSSQINGVMDSGEPRAPSPSAQTYDPLSSVRAPQGPIAQDPSIAGRAAQADKNYKTTSMGGNISRTYSDPDVNAGSLGQSYTDSILGGIRDAAISAGTGIKNGIDKMSSAINGPFPAAADPSFAGRVAASNNLATRFGNAAGSVYNRAADAVGSYIDNLMNQPLMGEKRVARASAPNTGSYPSRGTVGPGYSLSNGEGRVPGSVSGSTTATKDVKEIRDRVPQADGTPVSGPEMFSHLGIGIVRGSVLAKPNINASGVLGNRWGFSSLSKYGSLANADDMSIQQATSQLYTQDAKRQKVAQDIKNQRTKASLDKREANRAVVDNEFFDKRAPSAKVARDQQVTQGPAPEMSPEDILPAEPSRPQVSYGFPSFDPQQPKQRAAIDEAVRQAALSSQMARGIGDVAAVQPTQVDIPYGDPSVSPSQQGNYPPNENPIQDATQADDYGQLKNRFGYEKDMAVQGAKELPGKILDALIAGDFRKYNGTTNDKRDDIRQRRQMAQQALQGLSSSQQAALITQLMVLLQQTSLGGGNASQAALVNNTFPQG